MPYCTQHTRPTMLAASHLQRRDARTGVTLLQPATLAVQAGDRIALAGPSGAGKSELLQEAVRYQLIIMFLLAASTGLGTVAVVLLAYRRLFSREHQSLTARITQPSGAK